MNARMIRIPLAVVAAVLAATALAQGAATVGSVTVAIGPVQVFRAGQKEGVPAKPALDVRLGDRIETGPGGRAKVFLTRDNSVLQIGERSSLTIDAVEYSEAAKTHRAYFRLLAGKVRVLINRVFGVQADARVETPTAVAGVTGTTLIVGHDPARKVSVVLTVDGTARVTGVGGKRSAARDVAKGQVTFVPQGEAPSAPRAATAQEIEALLADTDVPGPPPTDLSRLDKRGLTDDPVAISVADAPGGGAGEPKDEARRAEDEEIGLEPLEPPLSGPGDDDLTDDDTTDDDDDADVDIDVQFPGS